MTEHFNGLTPAEAERLALLLEECGEVQHAIGKILRHGYESRWMGPTNRQSLERELGHLTAAIGLMVRADDANHGAINEAAVGKLSSVQQWLHHQPDSPGQAAAAP